MSTLLIQYPISKATLGTAPNIKRFVPQRYVRLVWQAVKANMPQLPRLKEFVTKYEETWLVGSYHLPFWNVFESGFIRPSNHVA